MNPNDPNAQMLDIVAARPAFIATKLEAFFGRGQGDYLFSHDLGDLLAVVDGRESLMDELRAGDPALRVAVAGAIDAILKVRAFRENLPGHLPGDSASQERLPDLFAKLERIAALSSA